MIVLQGFDLTQPQYKNASQFQMIMYFRFVVITHQHTINILNLGIYPTFKNSILRIATYISNFT